MIMVVDWLRDTTVKLPLMTNKVTILSKGRPLFTQLLFTFILKIHKDR